MIRTPMSLSRLAACAVIGAGLTLPLGAQVRPAAELPVIPAVASARPSRGPGRSPRACRSRSRTRTTGL
jgi:hypothetical protein